MNVKLDNLLEVYENVIVKNVKNKRKVILFDRNKMQNIVSIWNDLTNDNYHPDRYNIFLIFEPKCRIVMSLSIRDKIVNHYVAKYILIPKLDKYLDIRNVATRKNMGSDYGIKLIKNYLEYMKRYDDFYVLKIDIKKYFYNINHEVLKKMLIDKLDDKEYSLICKIIDSTNSNYINQEIDKFKYSNKYKTRKKDIDDLPYYCFNKGLSIGAMTSQFLSVFYLYELDHYIVNDLKIKCYCKYMDDLILFHNDKNYLKYCLKLISEKLNKKYDLLINERKTKIINIKDGFYFLGYNFKVVNKKTIIRLNSRSRKRIRDNLKKNNYLYKNRIIDFKSYFSSYNNLIYGFKYASNRIPIEELNVNLIK